jgi:hypothetical protein
MKEYKKLKAVWISEELANELNLFRETVFNKKGNNPTKKTIIEAALRRYMGEELKLFAQHIAHVEAVNNSETVEQHESKLLYLTAWRNGIKDSGIELSLIKPDMFYIDKDIDRPMCYGVWLDWEPTK